jgi:hypothetical protein
MIFYVLGVLLFLLLGSLDLPLWKTFSDLLLCKDSHICLRVMFQARN